MKPFSTVIFYVNIIIIIIDSCSISIFQFTAFFAMERNSLTSYIFSLGFGGMDDWPLYNDDVYLDKLQTRGVKEGC
jgi:hypothetical protein